MTQQLTQLARTVGHFAIRVEAQAAREETQWREMMTWMQERDQKWDACNDGDKLWGAGIANRIAMTMKV